MHQNSALAGLKRHAKSPVFDVFPIFDAYISGGLLTKRNLIREAYFAIVAPYFSIMAGYFAILEGGRGDNYARRGVSAVFFLVGNVKV